MIQMEQWNGFEGRLWKEEVNVRDFIQNNYKPYDGDASFLAGPTESTRLLWEELKKLQKEERAKKRRPGYGYRCGFYSYFPWSRLYQ